MACEPDLITTREAMYMKYIVINSGWYAMGRDYLLNETGESFLVSIPENSGPMVLHKCLALAT